jgi:hypothetical protein
MGVKNNAGQYLENLQTEPDIRVMNEYEIVSQGRDQQLEAAVAELLRLVGGNQGGKAVPRPAPLRPAVGRK